MDIDVAAYRRVAERWSVKGEGINASAAAVLILQLCDAIEGRWVSVTERLPEHDSNVLVAAKRDGEYVVKEMLFVDWSDPPDTPRPEWSDDFGGEKFENVTHWMPLPPAPPEVT